MAKLQEHLLRCQNEVFSQPMIGSKLAHYDVTAHLGSGGFGDVYQATDTKLGRSVAIKVLPVKHSRATPSASPDSGVKHACWRR